MFFNVFEAYSVVFFHLFMLNPKTWTSVQNTEFKRNLQIRMGMTVVRSQTTLCSVFDIFAFFDIKHLKFILFLQRICVCLFF